MSKYWSIADIAALKQMVSAGANQREMARKLGRTVSAVYYQLHRDRFQKRNRSAYREYKALRQSMGQIKNVDVPEHLWIERDMRRNEYRSPIQELLGDPPFSQSALSKR